MTFFPGTVPTFPVYTNEIDLVDADHQKDPNDEINAIASALGTFPAGNNLSLANRIGAALATDGTLRHGSAFPAGSDGLPFWRTDEETFYVYGAASGTWRSSTQLSNVVFSLGAVCHTVAGAGSGVVTSGELGQTAQSKFQYHSCISNDYTDATILQTKFKKISGMSTINVFTQLWNISSGNTTSLLCTLGGAGGTTVSGEIAGTAVGTNPTWNNLPVDVSGLTNGSIYDVFVKIKTSAGSGFAGNLIGIIS